MNHRLPSSRFVSLLALTLLGGCTWLESYPGGPGTPAMNPPPQVKIVQTADGTYLKPVGAPVEHTLTMGTNADKDAMSRLSNLEHQVEAMQTDMNSMMPVLSQMVAVQTNIQTMLARLQANGALPPAPNSPANGPPNGPSEPPPPALPTTTPLPPPIAEHDTNANGAMNAQAATGDNARTQDAIAPLAGAPPPPSADKMPTPVTPPPDKMAAASAAPAPASTTSPSATDAKPPTALLQDVRVGEHPGMTRIVLDLSNKVAFSNDLDNDEHILTIDLKGAGWKGPTDVRKITHSPLLVSWQTQADGQGGTRIIMQLSKSAKITASQTLPAKGKEPAKIVVDLTAN